MEGNLLCREYTSVKVAYDFRIHLPQVVPGHAQGSMD